MYGMYGMYGFRMLGAQKLQDVRGSEASAKGKIPQVACGLLVLQTGLKTALEIGLDVGLEMGPG